MNKLILLLFLTACYIGAFQVLEANAKPQCYFVDGKALCGEEGERARMEDRQKVEELRRRQLQQRNSRQRGDDSDLPQADDPSRMNGGSSRWMQTGPAPSTSVNNDKGHERPIKGQLRPPPTTQAPTTTQAPPCPPRTTTTTTTTEPPCPLAITTTPTPETPCEKYRIEQLGIRSKQSAAFRSRGFQSDQPNMESIPCPSYIENMMMADDAQTSEENDIGVNLRGDSAEINFVQVEVSNRQPSPQNQDVSNMVETSAHGIPSYMNSILPNRMRPGQRGKLTHYFSFQKGGAPYIETTTEADTSNNYYYPSYPNDEESHSDYNYNN